MATTLDISLHPGQYAAHISPARFRVLGCGRRWGKTRLGVNECIDTANNGGRAWWVAPSYKMSEVGWRPLHKIGTLLGAEVRKGDRQIIMPSGGEVTVRSADNPDSLRGEGLNLVVMDECAFIAEAAWTDAIRPALSDRHGRAIFISTPKGRNWFWRLYQNGIGDDSDWQSWQLPTSDNPFIDAAEIEAARRDLPEIIFEQEYLAQFLESQGAVFRNIRACLYPGDGDSHAGHTVVMGIDWGKQADFTAISIGCADCHKEIAKDRSNQIDYTFQRARVAQLVEQYSVTSILAESNAMGEPIIEELQRADLPVVGFQTTAQSKPPLIENLALTLERGEWQFLDDAIWTGELEAYERKISPITGRSAYSAPDGLHDDTVIARALMVRAAGSYGVFFA